VGTFNEADHPRDPKGVPTGGRFTSKITRGSAFEKALKDTMEFGGYTIQPVTGDVPRKGFAVSIFPEHSMVLDSKNVSLKDLVKYTFAKGEQFSDKANHLGLWQHEGKTYFDVTRVVSTHEEARALSLKHDQIGYHDLATHEDHIVNKSAKSGQGP